MNFLTSHISDNHAAAYRNKLLSVAYMLSGCCGLIYQTIWIRKFTLVFGSTIFSMSMVIAVFFGGLALGSHTFGKVSKRTGHPVRLYAVMEIIISLYALAFPMMLGLMDRVYASLYSSISHDFIILILVKALLCCLLLLPPTAIMGGTLPILARHFIKRIPDVGRQTGLIYGLNTLGAAMGCLLAGYLLLHSLGISQTNTLTGLTNLAIGILVWFLRGQASDNRGLPSEIIAQQGLEQSPVKAAHRSGLLLITMICFGVSGFVSISYEIIWLRYILLYLRDTSYLTSGIITIFIFGTALGSFLYGRHANRARHPLAVLGFLQLGIGLSTIIAIYLPIPWYHDIVEAGEGSSVNTLGFLFLLLIVPTLLMGATFPAVVRIIGNEIKSVGNRIGQAYAVNTLGAILGSLAVGFFLFMVMGLQTALYILFGLNMAAAFILILKESKSFNKGWAAIPLALCCLFPIINEGFFKCHVPEQIIQRISQGNDILEISEGVTGTAWVTRSPRFDQVSLLDNRTVISRSDSSGFVIQGFIPQLLMPEIPKRVLGLCFGGGLSYYAGRLFPETKHLDLVDISRHNMDLALKHIPLNRGFETDPRARFVVDDAYNYVKYTHLKYDLVIMDPTPPVFSYRCAALYTREFYTFARSRLTRSGFFSQVLPLGHMSDEETVNVMKTFASVFPHCLLWWNGYEPVMIGSNREFKFDVHQINSRITRPDINKGLDIYSKEADYTRLSHFLSGLLLTSGDFKKVGASGTIYTNDLNRLELSSWDNINMDNITRIHQSLTPWTDAVALFVGLDLKKYAPQLTARREYLMGILYKINRTGVLQARSGEPVFKL